MINKINASIWNNVFTGFCKNVAPDEYKADY